MFISCGNQNQLTNNKAVIPAAILKYRFAHEGFLHDAKATIKFEGKAHIIL